MKKLYLLVILLVLQMFVLNSCADVTEENNTTSASFNNIEEYIDGVLPSVYASLRSGRLYSQGGFTTQWGDNGVDVLGVASFNSSGHRELHGYAFDTGLQAISETWIQYYKGIATANNFLDILNDFPSDENQEIKKNQAIAEARFIRALLYFDMVKIWGDVPLITLEDATLSGVLENSDIGNSTAAEIYVQIEKDLLYAEEFAMSKSEAGSADIASKEAASALLGKMYLQMTTKTAFGGVEGGIDSDGNPVSVNDRYAMAKAALEKVIGKYSLEPNFADVFDNDNEESNAEVIFAVGFDGPDLGVGSNYGDILGPVGDGRNGAFNSFRPNIDFCFQYLMLDGLVSKTETDANGFALPLPDGVPQDQRVMASNFSISNPGRLLGLENFVSDSRFETTIARYIGTTLAGFLEGTTNPNITRFDVFNINTGGWQVLKYDKPVPNPNGIGDGAADFPYLRYADVLLMYAEVLNELGDQSQALEYVNMVRRRALKTHILKDIPAGTYVFPDLENGVAGTPQSELNNRIESNLVELTDADIQERLVPSGLSKDGMLDAILFERKLELAYEGSRKDDLLRTGKIQDAINLVRENSINLVDPLPAVNFELPKHAHWPIPTRDINLNPNLKQNCHYGSSNAGCF